MFCCVTLGKLGHLLELHEDSTNANGMGISHEVLSPALDADVLGTR